MRNRNKVSIGEPTKGSLLKPALQNDQRTRLNTRKKARGILATDLTSSVGSHLAGTNEPWHYLREGKETNERARAGSRRRCVPRELRVLRYVKMTWQQISRLSHR
ncbi:hypothetical protein TorRG33x02_173900 [Trema orientale]|uniref:Uncharacterized protein n=1 Tax=Trema orientale TaxID=63057 RepID=A0A2P5EMT1_TREOI|nr:hypothetical protein TorRG33x02_173900 [Trema orientale]